MKYQNYFSGVLIATGIGFLASGAPTQAASAPGPYKVLSTTQIMGTGGIDYIWADNDAHRVYVPRGTQILGCDLDALKPGVLVLKDTDIIPDTGGHGVVVDPKTHHGFSSASQICMFDTQTMKLIKKITVQGRPDGILFEPLMEQVYILSHTAPNVTVIDATDGSVLGTIDLGGAPEQAASDGQGHVYVDVEDKDNIAVVDAKTRKVTAHYPLAGKGGGPAGMGLDIKNGIIFAMCHSPATCVILNAADGKILATLPIASGTDGGGFNPNTMEAFSSSGGGTLTIIKENSPTSFEVEQTVQTRSGGKCCTLDTKNNHILVTAIEAAPAAARDGAPAATPPAGGRRAGAGAGGGGGAARGGGGRGGPGYLDIMVVGR